MKTNIAEYFGNSNRFSTTLVPASLLGLSEDRKDRDHFDGLTIFDYRESNKWQAGLFLENQSNRESLAQSLAIKELTKRDHGMLVFTITWKSIL